MKTHPHLLRFRKPPVLLAVLLGLGMRLFAITPAEWHHTQALDAGAAGLVRVELPPETLDAARPSLEDLRLVDGSGKEVPYLIERPMPKAGSVLRAKDFHAEIGNGQTTITLQTGTPVPLTGVILETPAAGFVKAARVEGSHDAKNWTQLAAGQSVFRLPRGAERLDIPFATGAWEFLRLTISDDRAQPVPFTGAQLSTAGIAAPAGKVDVSIKSRTESPGVTRLALDLGAANLPVASLGIETTDPLFTRNVTFAVQEVTEEGIREQPLGQAVVYRVNIDGKNAEHLEIPVEQTIRSRELLLLVRNEDSPPLAITAVHGARRLVRLVFYAREPGRYTLLSGNSQCAAPNYDLPALGAQLNTSAAAVAKLSPLADSPGYKAPEALAALPLAGVNIDLADWKFRKPVQVQAAGMQQLELDLEVLAHALPNQQDLRLVRDGKQLPFLFEWPSISRDIALNASAVVDPKIPALSRWSLKLPLPGLPVTRLVCVSTSPLFQREMRLWEEITDERGDKYPRELGRATWRQTPDDAGSEFVITFDQVPSGDTLFLETDNGDNPAIELRGFRCFYPVTGMVFKASPDASKPVWLYYGNPGAAAPRYDLGLIASELRGEKSNVTMGAEEPVKEPHKPAGGESTDRGGLIFWGVLGVVVIVLLLFISKLLPKTGGEINKQL